MFQFYLCSTAINLKIIRLFLLGFVSASCLLELMSSILVIIRYELIMIQI